MKLRIIAVLVLAVCGYVAFAQQKPQKYIVTVPVDTRKPIEVEATGRLDALVRALHATVWTEQEWKESQAILQRPKIEPEVEECPAGTEWKCVFGGPRAILDCDCMHKEKPDKTSLHKEAGD